MKLSFLAATSQINSVTGRSLGTGTIESLRNLAELMSNLGIHGNIYDLPNGSRSPNMASPFSLSNGFALNTDELCIQKIPEFHNNKSLKKSVQKFELTYKTFFTQNRTVSYTLKRTIMPWILEECFQVFLDQRLQHRLDQFEEFKELAAYWLEDFAQHEIKKEKGASKERLEYVQYIQFLCFEQRRRLREDLRNMNIGLIVNLPFGVELDSADVFFHPEAFDPSQQIGCSPEPENGYPEQAWGMAAYRENSKGLGRYLREKMSWIRLLGDGVFFDHLVGWCGQYLLPMQIPKNTAAPHGAFLTVDPKKRCSNLEWFLDIPLSLGLEIRGEIAGDWERVQVTNKVVQQYIKKGKDIKTMVIPRWEIQDGRLMPLKKHSVDALMMIETHDTSTLLQYLCNKKGNRDDYEHPNRILEFCNRVLALPFSISDVPLETEEMSQEFCEELIKRIVFGSPCKELVFSLPSLLSFLVPSERKTTILNNINVQPGTSGEVGNETRNWCNFSPPIELFSEDKLLASFMKHLSKRSFSPLDYFHQIEVPNEYGENLYVIASNPMGRNIVTKQSGGQWNLLNLDQLGEKNSPQLELLIVNEGENEIFTWIDLSKILELKLVKKWRFIDIADQMQTYIYSSQDLKNKGLYVQLKKTTKHHFLLFSC